MGTTLPVPNQQSPLVDVATGKVLRPWNSWFQQFSQSSPAIKSVSTSPFTANANGTVIIKGGTGVTLTRGAVTIALGTGLFIIPISIGDSIAWATATSVQFLGA